MKLPVSDMMAALTPSAEVFDVHTVVSPSRRRRLPVLSKTKVADLPTGEFLIRLLRENEMVGFKSDLPAKAFINSRDGEMACDSSKLKNQKP